MEAQGWGEQGRAVSLTYLNARDHLLTLPPVVGAGAHTLDPIPGAFILAEQVVLAVVSFVAAGANTDLPVPCPSI